MSRLIKINVLLIFLFLSSASFAITDQSNPIKAPPESARVMVTEAWDLMFPNVGVSPDFKRAFELNERAYQLGHFEGASNIGLIYEQGLGVPQDIEAAIKWYLIAQSSRYHSPQAEIGLARITLQKSNSQASLNSVAYYIQAARKVATDPTSLWFDEREGFLKQIELLQQQYDVLK